MTAKRKSTPRLVKVHTWPANAPDDAEPESTREFDWNSLKDRDWFNKHSHWCICNGGTFSVEPCPKDS